MKTLLAVGRLRTTALVEVVRLKMFPAVPVETLLIRSFTMMVVLDWRFLEASVVTSRLAVKVARLKLPIAETLTKAVPEEDAKTNKFLVLVAIFCTNKVAVGDVVPTATLALAST